VHVPAALCAKAGNPLSAAKMTVNLATLMLHPAENAITGGAVDDGGSRDTAVLPGR
jgi:hypothetical protein